MLTREFAQTKRMRIRDIVNSRVCAHASQPKPRMCEFATWSIVTCADTRAYHFWPKLHTLNQRHDQLARMKFLQLLSGLWPDGPNVQYSLYQSVKIEGSLIQHYALLLNECFFLYLFQGSWLPYIFELENKRHIVYLPTSYVL